MTNHITGQGAEPIRQQLRDGLRAALGRQDRVAVRTLRILLAAIDNAEAVDIALAPLAAEGYADVPRRLLSADETRAVLAAEARACQEAGRILAQHGRAAAAAEKQAELAVMDSFGITPL